MNNINTLLWLLFIINLILILRYLNSKRRKQGTGKTAMFLLSAVERPMAAAARGTSDFLKNALGDEFTFRNLLLYIFLTAVSLIALATEYVFLASTFGLILEESETSWGIDILSGHFGLSGLMAVVTCCVGAVAGLYAFHGRRYPIKINQNGNNRIQELSIGSANDFDLDHPSTDIFWRKLIAWNMLVVLTVLEGWVGVTRASEISFFNALAEAIGNGSAVISASGNKELIGIVNAFISSVTILISAATMRYVLIVAVWLAALATTPIFTFFIWLPRWVIGSIASLIKTKYANDSQADLFDDNLTRYHMDIDNE